MNKENKNYFIFKDEEHHFLNKTTKLGKEQSVLIINGL